MNATFKKILVPVDFSPSSKLAVEHALALAGHFQGTVHVLHAWELPAYLRPDLTVWSGELNAPLELHARGEAEKAMREFVADTHLKDRPDVTTELRSGVLYSTILAVAEQGEFDLIVMGTHGRTGFSHVVLGSVAEKIVRLAKCPVLTVRVPPESPR